MAVSVDRPGRVTTKLGSISAYAVRGGRSHYVTSAPAPQKSQIAQKAGKTAETTSTKTSKPSSRKR
jgi:hypothetical protein